jgi:hypothetical protein
MRGPSRNYDAWALSSSLVSLHFLSDGMADPDTYGNPERDIEQVSFIIRLIFFFSVKINYMVLDFFFLNFYSFFHSIIILFVSKLCSSDTSDRRRLCVICVWVSDTTLTRDCIQSLPCFQIVICINVDIVFGVRVSAS